MKHAWLPPADGPLFGGERPVTHVRGDRPSGDHEDGPADEGPRYDPAGSVDTRVAVPVPARAHSGLLEPELQIKKVPRQRRSRATFEGIVDSCARLMAERGYIGVTTNHIAAAAGIGIASLYEYFPGKDAIVAVVAERLVARVMTRLGEAAPAMLELPPHLGPRAWIECIHDIIDGERDLVAVFYYQVPYTNRLPAVRAITPRLFDLSRALRQHAGSRVTLVREPATLHLMINLVSTTILQLVLDPPPEVSKDQLIAALADRISRWTSGE